MTNPTPHQLITYANAFESNFIRQAYVRKVKDKWKVFSHKGKVLGTYDTRAAAVKRLKQIEFFKSKKASTDQDQTYSSIMRDLNKNEDPKTVKEFRSIYKKVFDEAYINNEKHPEHLALNAAKEFLQKDAKTFDNFIKKVALNTTDLGDPQSVGVYLAGLIHWLLRKISPDKRSKAVETMKKKIWYINEYQISSKKTPASAVFGQIITLLKTTLLKKDPAYIRQVLNQIVRQL